MLDPPLVSVASRAKTNAHISNLTMDPVLGKHLICIDEKESIWVNFLLVR